MIFCQQQLLFSFRWKTLTIGGYRNAAILLFWFKYRLITLDVGTVERIANILAVVHARCVNHALRDAHNMCARFSSVCRYTFLAFPAYPDLQAHL